MLGFAVVLARAADADTFHLLRCMAATLPLAAGYNRTARASARGSWLSGLLALDMYSTEFLASCHKMAYLANQAKRWKELSAGLEGAVFPTDGI